MKCPNGLDASTPSARHSVYLQEPQEVRALRRRRSSRAAPEEEEEEEQPREEQNREEQTREVEWKTETPTRRGRRPATQAQDTTSSTSSSTSTTTSISKGLHSGARETVSGLQPRKELMGPIRNIKPPNLYASFPLPLWKLSSGQGEMKRCWRDAVLIHAFFPYWFQSGCHQQWESHGHSQQEYEATWIPIHMWTKRG